MSTTVTLPNGVEIGNWGKVDYTVDSFDIEELAFAHVCRSVRTQLQQHGGLIVTMPAGDDVLGYALREEQRRDGRRDELDDTDSLFVDVHALTMEFDVPREEHMDEHAVTELLAHARPESKLRVENVELLELRDGPMALIRCTPPRAISFKDLVLEVQLIRGAYVARLYRA